ncbi:hypothetical protein AB205_0008520, partial [Aquarana catesbeiana]
MSPVESLLTSDVPSGVPPYIRCPQESPSLHQVSPAMSLLTSGVPNGVPPYITGVPSRVPPGVSGGVRPGVPSGVPPYIRCPQCSSSLHQVSPVESLLTSQVSPVEVSPAESLLTSIRFPQRSPSLHQVSPSESLLTSGVPSGVPPYIRCPHRSPSLHQCLSRVPLYMSLHPALHLLMVSTPFTEDQLVETEGKNQ